MIIQFGVPPFSKYVLCTAYRIHSGGMPPYIAEAEGKIYVGK